MDTKELEQINRALSPGVIAVSAVGGGMLAGFMSLGMPTWYMPWGFTAWLVLCCLNVWFVRPLSHAACALGSIFLLAGPGLVEWLLENSGADRGIRAMPDAIDLGMVKTLVAVGTLVVPMAGIVSAGVQRRHTRGWRRYPASPHPADTGCRVQFNVEETLEQRFARQRVNREREKANKAQ